MDCRSGFVTSATTGDREARDRTETGTREETAREARAKTAAQARQGKSHREALDPMVRFSRVVRFWPSFTMEVGVFLKGLRDVRDPREMRQSCLLREVRAERAGHQAEALLL